MLTEIPAEQFVAALERCAEEILAETEIVSPPVDSIRVAKRLELSLATDTTMRERARFVRLPATGRGTILLAEEDRPERVQWAVAHEIGEHRAYRVVELLGIDLVDLPASGRERIANRLASCLLLPKPWFSADGRAAEWDLLDLKSIYRTASHELIARRMLEMRPLVIVSLFDQGELRWRIGNSNLRPSSLVSAERDTWQTTFESGRSATYEGDLSGQGIADIRCWPVHEPGWRREILRTELAEW